MGYPDLAHVAIPLSFILIALATVVGYYSGDDWETISDMITRSDRLRNAFALIMGVSLSLQMYFASAMYTRYTKRASLYGHTLYGVSLPLLVGLAGSLGGSVGFAIVSTDISQDEHIIFAGTAFVGIWIYLATFKGLAWYYPKETTGSDKATVYPRMALATILVPFAMILLHAIGVMDDGLDYVTEFVFVAAMHLCAYCVYLPVQAELKGKRRYQAPSWALLEHVQQTPLQF